MDEDGDRLRPVGMLPDGRLSKARKGWGEVTVGREGIEEFDLELFVYWSGFNDGEGRVDITGTDAAARFCSCRAFSRHWGDSTKCNAPRRQNISWYNDSSIWAALPQRIRCKPLLNL